MVKNSNVKKTCLNIQAHTMFLCDDLEALQDNFKILISDQLNQLNVDDESEDVKTIKKKTQYFAETVNESMQKVFNMILSIQDMLEIALREN